MELWCQLTVVSSSSPARAQLVVNMEDRVEVLRGQSAQITCTFVSSEGIGAMIIQWFYVSGSRHTRPLWGGGGETWKLSLIFLSAL